jgi:large subunit ribosomal protein L9
MEVILREHVEHLGARGDVVKVTPGYARNYLLPRKLALAVTENNKAPDRAREEARRSARQGREVGGRGGRGPAGAPSTSRSRAASARTTPSTGSVTSADIAQALKDKGFEVDKRKIQLPDPLKALGEITVPVKIHREGDFRAGQGQGRRGPEISLPLAVCGRRLPGSRFSEP